MRIRVIATAISRSEESSGEKRRQIPAGATGLPAERGREAGCSSSIGQTPAGRSDEIIHVDRYDVKMKT
jgi:hypothetical protein